MGRKINQKVLIKDVFFDEELYPRSGYNWQTGYDYSESMKTGAKFPPIILALYKKKLYLVDGKHRLEAHKILKLKKIDAVVYTGWDKKKIYTEAVRTNINHGRVLSPYEKRTIAMKLLEFKYKDKEISKIINVPTEKLEKFVAQRSVNVLTGTSTEDSAKVSKEIAQVILKSGAGHISGETVSEDKAMVIENVQKSWSMHSQIRLFQQVIDLIENDLVDLDNKDVLERFNYLKNLFIGRS